MLVADILVSNSVHNASTFECDRGGQVHGLRCGPFSFPPCDMQSVARDVRRCSHLSGTTSFRQATRRGVRAQRSPASRSLGSEESSDHP